MKKKKVSGSVILVIIVIVIIAILAIIFIPKKGDNSNNENKDRNVPLSSDVISDYSNKITSAASENISGEELKRLLETIVEYNMQQKDKTLQIVVNIDQGLLADWGDTENNRIENGARTRGQVNAVKARVANDKHYKVTTQTEESTKNVRSITIANV